MLLLGGFAIAGALSKHFIAKSMATAILSRVGRQPHWVLLANMLVATFLSMFISNVAAPVLCFGLVQPILRTYAAGTSHSPLPPPPTSKSCCKIENCPPPPQPPPHATPKLCYKIETCPPPPPHAIPKPCCKIENCPPPPNPRPTPPQNLVAKLRATAGVLLWVGAAFLKTCVALKVLLGLQIWKHAAAVLLVDAAICLSVVSLSGRRKVKPAVTHAGMSLTGPNI